MSDQMTLTRSPWGIGWSLLAPAIGTQPNGPAATEAPYQNGPAGVQDQPFDPTGGLPAINPKSFKSRIGAALQGFGSQLNPYAGGAESFLSGLTGAYGNTQAALLANAQQPYTVGRQLAQDRYTDQHNAATLGLEGAQMDYYHHLANPAPVAPKRIEIDNPGQRPGYIDAATNVFHPYLDAAGQPLPVRPFPPSASLDGATSPHQVATERKDVRSQRAGIATGLRANANDLLGGLPFKGQMLSDMQTASDSADYQTGHRMRDQAAWLASHPPTTAQVDSMRAGTLDLDNSPFAGGVPASRQAPSGPQVAPEVRAAQLQSQGLNADAIKRQMAREGYRIAGYPAP